MFRGLRFRVYGSSFSCFGVFLFVFRDLRFRVLASSFSCFGVFVFVFWGLRSSIDLRFSGRVFVFSTTAVFGYIYVFMTAIVHRGRLHGEFQPGLKFQPG